jgi:hypothetical protein
MGKYLDIIRQAEDAQRLENSSGTSTPQANSNSATLPVTPPGKTDSPEPEPLQRTIQAVSTASPTAPLQAGWFVTYTDSQGHLCGGWDDRQRATVSFCVWRNRGWSVHLSNGQAIPLIAVRCVGQMNEDGELKAAWSVRQHGYDGESGC